MSAARPPEGARAPLVRLGDWLGGSSRADTASAAVRTARYARSGVPARVHGFDQALL
jgi:hypothetical protein